MPNESYWEKHATKNLVGKKIVMARYMSKEEAENMGWYSRPVVLQLNDGSIIFPSMDDEGNNGGALFGQDKDNNDITCPVLF
jgi:hypothetical protein